MGIALLCVTLIVFMVIGVPIAFCTGLASMLYLMSNPSIPSEVLSHRLTGSLFSLVLLALPAFLLVGRMFNVAGITDRIFDFAISLVGRIRGGLAQANAMASMMFASMSGTAVGDAGGLGVIEMEMMKKAGYRPAFAAGITAASSVLGPIIPPSVAMVILGATASVDIGRLFMGGVIPGILMGISLMVYVYLYARFTAEGRSWPVTKHDLKTMLRNFRRAILPLLTPVIIIGCITFGVVTPTEAAVLAIDYALLLGIVYRNISWKRLLETLEDCIETTGVFMFIFASAGVFGWLLTLEQVPQAVSDLLFSLTTDPTVILFLIVLFLLIVGAFLDTTAAILLVTPMLIPIVQQAGIDMIHFCIVLVVALIIGIITPPFGICLFVVSDVAKLPVTTVTRACLPYLVPMIIVVILLVLFPGLSTWLPRLIFG
ncbi:MAG: hypothetical protein BAA02_05455 [Paenibacillaceae bacterium ZCTH02-B3]|nr:MAG: hypothetical protein BAA02_05455 [Paenibacillaceae bacterium ZCTH02-B3]